MTTKEIDRYFRSVLDFETFGTADSSMNGIQVDNDGAEVTKIAFALDASLETFKRAAGSGAGLLFVHHGLYWGAPLRVESVLRGRLDLLLKNNLALYAAHLPLDAAARFGINAVLAGKLGMENIERFGLYHGKKIGFKGSLASPLTTQEAAAKIAYNSAPPLAVLPFGKELNRTCALIAGGAAMEAVQAVEEGVDLYITGECGHSVYHHVLEGRLNFIAGGHYSTEVWGVLSLMEKTSKELGIGTCFIDVPTGL